MRIAAVLTGIRHGVGTPLEALRRSLGNPRLVRLQLAWAAVMIASWTTTVGLSVVAFSEGGSAAVALAVLARTVPGLVAGPVVGALVDRFPRRRCLTAAAALSAMGCLGAAFAAGTLVAATGLVTVVALVTMLFRTAQSAVLPELVSEPSDLTAANVLSSAVESVGVFAGPVLAAGLLALQGPELAFAGSAGLFVAAGGLVRGLPDRPATPDGEVAEASGSLRELLALRGARLVLTLLLAQTVVSGALVVLYPALAVASLDLPVSAVGLLAAAFGLGGLLGSLGLFALAGSRRLGICSAAALLLWSMPLLALVLQPELAVVLVLLGIVGAGNVLFDVTSVTLLQRAVPIRLLGRAFGAVETVVVAGLGVGAVAAPVAEELVGPDAALAVLALPLALVALLGVPGLRRLDRELAAPVRQVALLRALAPFALLPPLQLERLALHLRRVELAQGQLAVRQGEVGTSWFLLETGRLMVEVDGRAVRDIEPGEGVGEVALLHDGVRTATLTALVPSVLWSLEGDVFLAALRTDGGRALGALHAIAEDNLRRAAPAGG
jgi:MFS family permease